MSLAVCGFRNNVTVLFFCEVCLMLCSDVCVVYTVKQCVMFVFDYHTCFTETIFPLLLRVASCFDGEFGVGEPPSGDQLS